MRTIDELADALRIHRSTVSRAAARGAIRAIRVGRLIRIPQDEFERIVRVGLGSSSAPAL